MKIESRGVDITDVPGVERITVERDSMVIDMESKIGRYSIAQVTQIRNALDAALEQHAKFDTAMTTPNPATFRLGQGLAGDEDLPVGAVVMDGEGDRWYHIMPGLYSTDPSSRHPRRKLPEIVSLHRGAKIVSLP